jgi:hypothetical protein
MTDPWGVGTVTLAVPVKPSVRAKPSAVAASKTAQISPKKHLSDLIFAFFSPIGWVRQL